ncbi:hypothetical protein D0864_05258 [Hortaea werneckii]|uniref:Moybdenum cofactor oxidoreductase dimerisation domain-containing protein n=1 Tax=Hortaea werneckii TaxID=91943 RepID=A0A3M7G3U7_HORWE|nr:hypothetical protein D0864_05258 [Hortaea werneckii]
MQTVQTKLRFKDSGLLDHYELAEGDCKSFGQLTRICRNVKFLRKYAFSGSGRHIMRVGVSPNMKETWQQAHLESIQEQKDHCTWSGRHWDLASPTRLLLGNVCIKAADNNECKTQPAILDAYYKSRSSMASGGHRMPKQEALHAAVVHKK